MQKFCYDHDRGEINQQIMCLTEEEMDEQPRDYPLNECLPELTFRFTSEGYR